MLCGVLVYMCVCWKCVVCSGDVCCCVCVFLDVLLGDDDVLLYCELCVVVYCLVCVSVVYVYK